VTPPVTPPIVTCEECFAPLLLDLTVAEELALRGTLGLSPISITPICDLQVMDESNLRVALGVGGVIANLPNQPFTGLTEAQIDALIVCLELAGEVVVD
jgi:hypothetical protein